MEKWKKRSVDLLSSLSFGSKDGSLSVIPYYPQKTEISRYEERELIRSVPEKHGISSARLYNMLCDLEGEKRANIHNLAVLADGEVITECSRDGYGVNIQHLSHSMSKTVTGMAIGMLCDEGKLDPSMRLVDLLPGYPYKDKRVASITLHHLLSMTSGVSFSEAGSVTESRWTAAFFASEIKFNPGTKFNYNSMNSYILARIAVKVSGESLTSFLERRLFAPLGITGYFWEKSPEGIEKGGWGLYLSVESWAKIGVMFMEGGKYRGARILSEEWVKKSSSTHAIAPLADGDFNYGYQLWVGRRGDEILFNGMLGQNVWIYPKNRIVAVINSGNNEMFQDSPALDILRRYLSGAIEDELHRRDVKILHQRETSFFDSRRWVRPLEKKHGIAYWLGMRGRKPFDERWSDILGSYAFGSNNIGLLPLFIRGMQNNLSSVMERMTFDRYGDRLFFIFRETGEEYRLEIGLYEYRQSVLDFRGEKYIVRAMGEALLLPDGTEEYRLEFIFPELPNTRFIRIRPEGDDRIRVIFSEIPNDRMVTMLMESYIAANPAAGFAIDILERRFGEGFIEKKLHSTFTPELIGADTSREGYGQIIDAETRRANEESGFVKLLRAVVDRFFKEDEKAPDLPRKARKDAKKRAAKQEEPPKEKAVSLAKGSALREKGDNGAPAASRAMTSASAVTAEKAERAEGAITLTLPPRLEKEALANAREVARQKKLLAREARKRELRKGRLEIPESMKREPPEEAVSAPLPDPRAGLNPGELAVPDALKREPIPSEEAAVAPNNTPICGELSVPEGMRREAKSDNEGERAAHPMLHPGELSVPEGMRREGQDAPSDGREGLLPGELSLPVGMKREKEEKAKASRTPLGIIGRIFGNKD